MKKCLECGKCCQRHIHQIRGKVDEETARMMEWRGIRIVEYKGNRYLVFDNQRCRYLTADNKCSIYNARPNGCRDFPINTLDVLLPEGCGYKADKTVKV